MTLEEDKALSQASYWDGRYRQSQGDVPTHEWFRAFNELEPFFQKNLFQAQGLQAGDNPQILHLGSGDSTVPSELASRGYRRQLCVDFSTVVVDTMSQRHSRIEGIVWKQVDVRDMSDISNESIDVAFDKGTLDAMIHGSPWSPPDEVRENTSKYLKEVHRVLKDQGVFLYITFRQPHFMRPLLNADDLWNMDMQVLGDGGSFDYYGFIVKKKTSQ
ncbi:Queuine tRNA-ribosyltransferase-like protein [Elsinoe australis]|uniref:Queuine tRNA-ribosyltransferase-like protein n=1 Tax=Elsinoe australis TaxID=40998 RepID=A0A2P7Z7N2_9PEZI|nr:Queuine tRNA-ribosyltransferase-like protein [Elsinoe australis]